MHEPVTISAVSALRVVSSPCTCGESRFANLDLKAVILVRMVSRGRIKGESVKGGCVHHTARNRAGDVIARIENSPATLSCEHLQPKVAVLHPVGRRHTLEEALVIKRFGATRICHPQRIKAVERDASLSQCRRQLDNHAEDRLLVLLAQLHVRPGQNGSSWTAPDQQFSSRLGRLIGGESFESAEGNPNAIHTAIE